MGEPLSRRAALALLGTGVATTAACGTGFALRDTRPASDDELLVTLWTASAERAPFARLAQRFTQRTGTSVRLQTVPFTQRLTAVNTGLRAGSAPDVFRVTYNDIGFYRDAGVLAPLPDAASLRPAFAPAFWSAVDDGTGGAIGVPHHTDTSMVLVNTDAARAANLGPLPTDPAQAWSWEQFLDAARRVQAQARATRYATAVNWQVAASYRWLNWVDQAGGRLLAPDLTRAVSPDDPGLRRALSFTRGLFTEGLTPASASAGGTVTTDELFSAQTVAMAFAADFLLPTLTTTPFGWQAVPLPRDQRASADLGGNALAAPTGPRQEQALSFLRFCVEPEQMADFCAAASALPTRTDVPAIRYGNDQLGRYVAQAGDVRTDVVDQITVPRAAAVITELEDALDRAFLTRDADEAVATDLVAAVDRAVRR